MCGCCKQNVLWWDSLGFELSHFDTDITNYCFVLPTQPGHPYESEYIEYCHPLPMKKPCLLIIDCNSGFTVSPVTCMFHTQIPEVVYT